MQKTAIQKVIEILEEVKSRFYTKLGDAAESREWEMTPVYDSAAKTLNEAIDYIQSFIPTEKQQILDAYKHGAWKGSYKFNPSWDKDQYIGDASDYYTSTFQTSTDATPNK